MSRYQRHHSKRHHCPHLQAPSAGQTLLWQPRRNRGDLPLSQHYLLILPVLPLLPLINTLLNKISQCCYYPTILLAFANTVISTQETTLSTDCVTAASANTTITTAEIANSTALQQECFLLLTTSSHHNCISFDCMLSWPPRCSRVGWAVSRRRRYPSSTPSIFRWSCVGAPHTRVAQVCWTRSMWRTSHRCWRSAMGTNNATCNRGQHCSVVVNTVQSKGLPQCQLRELQPFKDKRVQTETFKN